MSMESFSEGLKPPTIGNIHPTYGDSEHDPMFTFINIYCQVYALNSLTYLSSYKVLPVISWAITFSMCSERRGTLCMPMLEEV